MTINDLPETSKAKLNFCVCEHHVDLELIKNLALIKIAAAKANMELNILDEIIGNAIIKAAEEIVAGKHNEFFVTDAIQGGAGTSINMNVNEVIAQRANELLAENKVHPNDHVNLCQSTNDVIPSAFRITANKLLETYIKELHQLKQVFMNKSEQYKKINKVGRTHLQDAVPFTFGRQFLAYANLVARDIERLENIKPYLLQTNLGGTAIGTGAGAVPGYAELVHKYLNLLTANNFLPADDLVDVTQNIDTFYHLIAALKTSAIGLSKVCTDLRLLASGPNAGIAEIKLREMQKGSSIMPGKVNPVGLELFNQITFEVCGAESVATQVFFHGQLELNTMLPILIKNTIESFKYLINGVHTLSTKVINNLEVNVETSRNHLTNSYVIATYFNHLVGYDKNTELVKLAELNHRPYLEELRESSLLTPEVVDNVLQVNNLL